MDKQRNDIWYQWGPQGELSRWVYWIRTLVGLAFVATCVYGHPYWDHHIAWVNQKHIQMTLISSAQGFAWAAGVIFVSLVYGIWYLHQTVRRLRRVGLARRYLWLVVVPGIQIPLWLIALSMGDGRRDQMDVVEKVQKRKLSPEEEQAQESLFATHQEIRWILQQLDRELSDPSIAMQVQARTRAMQRVRTLMKKQPLDPNQCRLLRHMIQQRQRS